MSYRLQVLIPEELEARIAKAAQRSRKSKGAWVRQAIQHELDSHSGSSRSTAALSRLASLEAPTADIQDMLAEIEPGRS